MPLRNCCVCVCAFFVVGWRTSLRRASLPRVMGGYGRNRHVYGYIYNIAGSGVVVGGGARTLSCVCVLFFWWIGLRDCDDATFDGQGARGGAGVDVRTSECVVFGHIYVDRPAPLGRTVCPW